MIKEQKTTALTAADFQIGDRIQFAPDAGDKQRLVAAVVDSAGPNWLAVHGDGIHGAITIDGSVRKLDGATL